MAKRFAQPKRLPDDGPVEVEVRDGDLILVVVTTAGVPSQLYLSQYNASRLLGMLSLLLGVRLHPADAKAIKL